MALFDNLPRPSGAMDRGCFYPGNGMATYGAGCLPLPWGMMPQLMPNVLPSLFASSGFPFAAYVPSFVPFAASIPAMFYQSNNLGQNASHPNDHFVEIPSESSASTGTPFAQRSPHGKQKRMALFQDTSASRSSLESCSGTSRGTDAASLAASSADDSSMQQTEAALDLSAWPDLQSSSDLNNVPPFSVQFGAPKLPDVTAGAGKLHPAIGTLPTAAAGAPRPSMAHSPFQAAGSPCPASHQLSALVGPWKKTVTDPPVALAGDHGEHMDEDGSTFEVAPLPGRKVEQGAAPTGRVSERGGGRLPLPGPAGAVVWVDSRRYRAILRRRRQRASKDGCLAVAFPPCNRKPFLRVSRLDLRLALLGTQISGQLRNHTEDETARNDANADAGDSCCCGGGGSNSIKGDAGTACGCDRIGGGVSAPASSPGTTDSRGAPAAACANGAEALAAVAVAAAAFAATTGAFQADWVRAALEAELQAVLAEETGVLPSSSDATTDNGEEGENVRDVSSALGIA